MWSLGKVEASRRRRQLGWLPASRIQAVDGFTRTLTCTVIHR
jgi:hypothetical protein